MNRPLRLLLAAAIASSALAASAQTMYRCGSSYQDHPCGGGQAGTVIGTGSPSGSAQPATAASASSAQCSQRGIAAQKISWMREAGKTEQEQEATASGMLQRDLVADVYSRRGSSVQVRAAVEADCLAQEARAAQAAALVDAANRLKGGGASTSARAEPAANVPAPTGAAAPIARDNAAATEAANRKARCQGLVDQLNDVSARQRARNSAGVAEQLRQQYRDASDRLRNAGC